MPSAPTRVLVARLDNDGDVLLAGPTIRAVAASGARVTLLCGPRGERAARALPGVDEIAVFRAPWIDPDAPPVVVDDLAALVRLVHGHDEALILTSFHQDPLPLALLLRIAEIPRIGAICHDYPGSLLDVRHRPPEVGLHEVERALSLAEAMGYALPEGDEGALAVRPLAHPLPFALPEAPVVVHPGASVSARSWAPEHHRALVQALVDRGDPVVVTGGPDEVALTRFVTGRSGALDLGGRTRFDELAEVLRRARAVIVGNTGPAHLAAAAGTPIVSLFAPTVPAERWRPWQVPTVLLHRAVPCAGCRARTCPVPGHPCLDDLPVDEVVRALDAVSAPDAVWRSASAGTDLLHPNQGGTA